MSAKRSTISLNFNFQNPLILLDEVFEAGKSRMSRMRMNRTIENLKNFRFPQFHFRPNLNKKNILRIALPILAVFFLVIIVNQFLSPNSSIQGVNDTIDSKPVGVVNVNRSFQFPLRDEEGKELDKFTYVIESVEKRNQIVVKGQSATAVPGRIFLVINLKLVNSLNQGIQIQTRDYVRISVNNNNEWFAPDIHNDPVESQAISTKNTRVGLAINQTDKNIELRVGEINGKKETIKLNF